MRHVITAGDARHACATRKKTGGTYMKKTSSMATIGSILERFAVDEPDNRITREFQDYGYRLAVELNDMAHKALYIKMAKETPRHL